MAQLFGHEKLKVYWMGMDFVAKALLVAGDVYPGKSLLGEIVSILIAMKKTTANRIREDRAAYRTRKVRLFRHEDLDVYQAALQLTAWVEGMCVEFSVVG